MYLMLHLFDQKYNCLGNFGASYKTVMLNRQNICFHSDSISRKSECIPSVDCCSVVEVSILSSFCILLLPHRMVNKRLRDQILEYGYANPRKLRIVGAIEETKIDAKSDKIIITRVEILSAEW